MGASAGALNQVLDPRWDRPQLDVLDAGRVASHARRRSTRIVFPSPRPRLPSTVNGGVAPRTTNEGDESPAPSCTRLVHGTRRDQVAVFAVDRRGVSATLRRHRREASPICPWTGPRLRHCAGIARRVVVDPDAEVGWASPAGLMIDGQKSLSRIRLAPYVGRHEYPSVSLDPVGLVERVDAAHAPYTRTAAFGWALDGAPHVHRPNERESLHHSDQLLPTRRRSDPHRACLAAVAEKRRGQS